MRNLNSRRASGKIQNIFKLRITFATNNKQPHHDVSLGAVLQLLDLIT